MAENIHYRLAKFEDYSDICNIAPNLNEGMDYIPDMFYELMHDKNANCYVAEYESKVVAFYALLQLASKVNAISMSVRVLPSLQSLGLMHKIVDFGIRHSMGVWKEFNIITGTALFDPKIHSDLNKPGLFYIKKRAVNYFKTTREKLNMALEKINPSQELTVSQPNLKKSMEIVSNTKIMEKIIGRPYFVAYSQWGCCSVQSADMLEMIRSHRLHVTYKSASSNQDDIESISFGIICKVPMGLRYNIYYNGQKNQDFLAHVASHVRYSATLVPPSGHISYCICFEETLDRDALLQFMYPIAGKHLPKPNLYVETAYTILPIVHKDT